LAVLLILLIGLFLIM